MYQTLLRDARLFVLLLRIDEDVAREARRGGCPHCGDRLDSARYPRKPRGALELGLEYGFRLSFCCARRDCRRRLTPPSVRFLGRLVYLGAVVLIAAVLDARSTATERRQLRAWLGVSARTLARWRRWWRRLIPHGAFWRAVRGRFHTPVRTRELPASLLARFAGDLSSRVVSALRFLAPLTTGRLAVAATLGEGRRRSPVAPAEHA